MRERDGSRRGGKAEGRDEERPPTLKCRKIHSFSFFSSHKIVTRGPLKSRKCTRKRLATRLRLDPRGELKRFPDALAAILGLLLRGGEGKGVEGRGGKVERRKGRRGKRGAPTFVFKFTPLLMHDIISILCIPYLYSPAFPFLYCIYLSVCVCCLMVNKDYNYC